MEQLIAVARTAAQDLARVAPRLGPGMLVAMSASLALDKCLAGARRLGPVAAYDTIVDASSLVREQLAAWFTTSGDGLGDEHGEARGQVRAIVDALISIEATARIRARALRVPARRSR